MYTYKLEFNNGQKFISTTTKLDVTSVEAKVVKFINKNIDKGVVKCKILCPSGALSFVEKNGAKHWNHDGFRFDMIPAELAYLYKGN